MFSCVTPFLGPLLFLPTAAQFGNSFGATPLGGGVGNLGATSLAGTAAGSFGFGSKSMPAPTGTPTGNDIAAPLTRHPDDPVTLHRAFHYADVASHLLEPPSDRSIVDCRDRCFANQTCAAWEVCAPIGDGCDGCYLVRRAPTRYSERLGWHAEIIEGRETQEAQQPLENMTFDDCHEYLLAVNGADQGTAFHEHENLQKYTHCGFMLRDAKKPRQLSVMGKHYPIFVVTNFAEPAVELPADVEREMFASSTRPLRQPMVGSQAPGTTSQLHDQMGTASWEDHTRSKPSGPHAFVLPFYDTNIGHWVKQHGSMNPLQSYEMQSLLQPGDVVVDVGANLGCYTVPFAERVGPSGKVLAFEPFRWMHQLVSANVAINGISNAWVFPVGLGTGLSRFEARPPQLRFFSSPGGMRLQNQQEGMAQSEALQLYDWDSSPEIITVVSLDQALSQSPETALLGVPPIDNIRLIKIDVEGMEKEVIIGAQRAILQFKPIIWSENVGYFSSNGQDTSFLQLMEQLEYACSQAQNAPNDIVCTDKHGRGHQVLT